MLAKAPAKASQEGGPAPGYFFYGRESYLADVFIRDLQARLIPPDVPDFHLDVFHLDETGWAEILDTARTMPFFFSPWRIIVVRFPEKSPESERKPEKETRPVHAGDEKLLKAYFTSPPARTVMAILYPNKAKKGQPLVRLFSSLPGVVPREAKPLKDWEVGRWLEAKARSAGKAVTPGAAKRLLEIVGTDLRRMDNEIEKLAVYVGEKQTIDIEDVNQATAWVREFDPFELDNGLEKADLRECLLVLNNLFKRGEKPELILYRFVSYFRNILMARTRFEEKDSDRKAIFREVYPYIIESYGDLYQKKMTALFALVEGFSRAEFAGLLEALEKVDVMIKSSEVPARTAFEAFLFEYCRLRARGKITSRAWE